MLKWTQPTDYTTRGCSLRDEQSQSQAKLAWEVYEGKTQVRASIGKKQWVFRQVGKFRTVVAVLDGKNYERRGVFKAGFGRTSRLQLNEAERTEYRWREYKRNYEWAWLDSQGQPFISYQLDNGGYYGKLGQVTFDESKPLTDRQELLLALGWYLAILNSGVPYRLYINSVDGTPGGGSPRP